MSTASGGAPGSRAALAQVGKDQFSVQEAMGGPRGFIEAVLPTLVFVIWQTVTQDLRTSLILALAAAGVLTLVRLVQRSAVTQALAGSIGVGICAWWASRTGNAADFFAPGLLINIGYAALYAASTIRYPRLWRIPAWGPYPVIGLVVGPLLGEGLAWRNDPRRLRVYRQVTWLWVAMFVIRLAVQLPLYWAGAVGALGVARLIMGVPFFVVVGYITWLMLRRVPQTEAALVDETVPANGPELADGPELGMPSGRDQ